MRIQVTDKERRVIAITPSYGGMPVTFTLRGLGWLRFVAWMSRHALLWDDYDVRLYDSEGRYIKRIK